MGSTAIFERLGDSRAYALVRDHFDILEEVVAAHHGAIVKTIGDAIMATFDVSTEGIEALVAVQEAFKDFNARRGEPPELTIKVGAHRGPCIAVTSNERLDYFGRTINIAARVQNLSEGGDVLLSNSLHQEPGVADVFAGTGWRALPFEASLKGIADEFPVVRLQR